MKDWNGLIQQFPTSAKWVIALFLIALSYGFFAGIRFVEHTTDFKPEGIEESYLGNEEVEEVEIMKYEKTQNEMLTMFHTHVMSLSMVFFLSGLLVLMTDAPKGLKKTLAIEPLVSVMVTFGGIYWMWKGLVWLKYIVLLSGILMTVCFGIGVLLVLWNLCKKPTAALHSQKTPMP